MSECSKCGAPLPCTYHPRSADVEPKATATSLPSFRTSEDVRHELGRRFANFLLFCGLLWIQPKEGGGRIPLVLTPPQLQYNGRRTLWDIILKGRQIHITTLECARDVWWFFTRKGARVVIVVQSQSDNKPLLDVSYKVRLFMDSIRALMPGLKFGTETAHSWTLPDRDATLDIIVAGASDRSASKKGRAGTINRLHVSEASSYENAEATMTALFGALTPDAEVVVESTPKGASGWFYEQWMAATEGKSTFTPHFLEWWKNDEYRLPVPSDQPFVAEGKLEEALLAKGVAPESLLWYRARVRFFGSAEVVNQEYPSDPDTCFVLSGRNYFDTVKVNTLIRVAPEPIAVKMWREDGARGERVGNVEIPHLRVWHTPVAGHQYLMGVDTSEGTGGDAGAAIILERGTGRHMATLWGQLRPWVMGSIVAQVGRVYNGALAVVERNNHGHAVIQSLVNGSHYGARVFKDRDGQLGWLNHETTRSPALDAFEQAFRSINGFTTNDRFLLAEMRTMVVNDKGRAEAAKGRHDDLVLAAAIGWDALCRNYGAGDGWTLELPPA